LSCHCAPFDSPLPRQQQHHRQHTDSKNNIKRFTSPILAIFLVLGKKECIWGHSFAVCLAFSIMHFCKKETESFFEMQELQESEEFWQFLQECTA
jgi:hypothetical protein